jgi:hypothetical protein
MTEKIPIIESFIYYKIKKNNNSNIVGTGKLKEIIKRTLIKSPAGQGIPRCFIPEIIKDMENLNLIKRLSHLKFRILKSNCEERINQFIWFSGST